MGAVLDAGRLDELLMHVIPTPIGAGIPLIAPRHRCVPLERPASRESPGGVMRLNDSVPGRTASRVRTTRAPASEPGQEGRG